MYTDVWEEPASITIPYWCGHTAGRAAGKERTDIRRSGTEPSYLVLLRDLPVLHNDYCHQGNNGYDANRGDDDGHRGEPGVPPFHL